MQGGINSYNEKGIVSKRAELDFMHLKRFTEAMTHGSFDGDESNKQLALLGDAVIDLVVCEHILKKSPALSVGEITRQKSAVVNSVSLAQKARALHLTQYLRLGKQLQEEEETERILAESLEALAGAFFTECGYERTRQFIAKYIIPETIEMASWNPKGKLQEISQNAGLGVPDYVTEEKHMAGRPVFETTVFLEGTARGKGKGANKQEAEENAAKKALLTVKV